MIFFVEEQACALGVDKWKMKKGEFADIQWLASEELNLSFEIYDSARKELFENYIHSSAKFYMTGEQGIYPVTHFVEVYEGV